MGLRLNLEKRFMLGLYSSSDISPWIKKRTEEDRLSILPDELLSHILSYRSTAEAVWTSLLSSRWRYLWKSVHRLKLDSSDFPKDKACVDFITEFVNFQNDLREFKLTIDQDNLKYSNISLYDTCLGLVLNRNIRSFQVESNPGHFIMNEIPLTLTACCESLVCLKLHFVKLNDFSDAFSLPCLKVMYLEEVIFPSDVAVERLISSSPVLEDLKISLSDHDVVVVLRVYSLSLRSFTLKRVEPYYPKWNDTAVRTVVIGTPGLEFLSLVDHQFECFKVISMSDSVKVDIDANFEIIRDYLSERNIIYNLLNNFSSVGDMTISWKTLKLIYSFYDDNPLPKFHGLTRLHATMNANASLVLLPIVLESCPNLKHFTLELLNDYPVAVFYRLSNALSRCLVSSIEYVEMESPITERATELKLVKYFLKNSISLKKLVLRLNKSTEEVHKPGALKKLFEIPRRSKSCRFEVLPVVEIPNPCPWWVPVKTNRFLN